MKNITTEITGIPEFVSVLDKSCVLHSGIELIPLNPETYRGKAKDAWFSEILLSRAIAKKFKGKTEVQVKGVGKIDVLTDQSVIECKTAVNWKNGLGQVLAYGYYYPNRQKWLVLFSVGSDILLKQRDNTFDTVNMLNQIAEICLSYGVLLKLVSEASFERSVIEIFKEVLNPDYCCATLDSFD